MAKMSVLPKLSGDKHRSSKGEKRSQLTSRLLEINLYLNFDTYAALEHNVPDILYWRMEQALS